MDISVKTLTNKSILDTSSLGEQGVVGVPTQMKLFIKIQALEFTLNETK